MFRPLYPLLFAFAVGPGMVGAQSPAPLPMPRFNAPTQPQRPAPTTARQLPAERDGAATAAPDPVIVRPAPRINRNPAFREALPPAPVPRDSDRATIPPQTSDSSRATLVPPAGPCDPRNSTTRPVRIPEGDNPAASPCAP